MTEKEYTYDEHEHILPVTIYDMEELGEDEEFESVGDDDEEDEEEDFVSADKLFNDAANALRKHMNDALNNSRVSMKQKSRTPFLDKFSVDLTAKAKEKALDPVVGREKEISRIAEILCRRKKNNPVLIGEPGVGKSAIVEGLAQMISCNTVTPVLRNKRLLALDLTSLVAGTKYRGDFEERMKGLIKELEGTKDVIIFIDEIHTMIGAGSASGTMDAANILKPALARGTIQCIGATTLDEYRKSIEKDGALERRFQKVIVEQTTASETLTILMNLKEHYQHYHHVEYTDSALKACVNLTERYITDRAFPDKAIDALDEVGSRIRLRSATVSPKVARLEKEIEEINRKKKSAVFSQNFELAASYRDLQTKLNEKLNKARSSWENDDESNRPEITEVEVAEVVSMMSGVPVQKVGESEASRLRRLGDTLKKRVIGQDNAIEKISNAILRSRLGLQDPNRPIGAFMFLGPTGVGKTHLAQQLAIEMFGSKDALIRVDMSEFNESFNTSRLVGAPPGYVGYDEGGQLTERVRRHPYSIVLLDEIEKAHQNVFNLLLQVLDEGRLTDGNGRIIDFRNTIIIMTSNAGTRQLKDFSHSVGFGTHSDGTMSNEYGRSIIDKALRKQFAPEFLNRIDEIITFEQLSLDSIKSIIDIELKGLHKRVDALGFKLHITDKAKEYVATKGYDVQLGARPLKRAIQTLIEDAVCQKIILEEMAEGDVIKISKPKNSESLVTKVAVQNK